MREDYKLDVTACCSSYSENEFGRRTVVGKTDKMSLASHLNDIVEKIKVKDEDRAPYLSDAQTICNKLMEDLQKADSDFRKGFNGLSLSGKSFAKTVCLFNFGVIMSILQFRKLLGPFESEDARRI